MLAGFIVTAVYAALGLAAAAISALGGITRAQFEGQPVLPPEVPLALGSLVQVLATGLQVAFGVSSTAGVAFGLVGGLVALATLVWHVVLVVIGASLDRRIGYGESAGSCAISCAGCLGLIILVAVLPAGIGILIGTMAPQ